MNSLNKFYAFFSSEIVLPNCLEAPQIFLRGHLVVHPVSSGLTVGPEQEEGIPQVAYIVAGHPLMEGFFEDVTPQPVCQLPA